MWWATVEGENEWTQSKNDITLVSFFLSLNSYFLFLFLFLLRDSVWVLTNLVFSLDIFLPPFHTLFVLSYITMAYIKSVHNDMFHMTNITRKDQHQLLIHNQNTSMTVS